MNLDPNHPFRYLSHLLSDPLPGWEAQVQMAPEGREYELREQPHTAAVLIALHYQAGDWRLPLIRRVEDDYAHSGQFAFPGGRIEPGETPEQAAVREAEEEIGLKSDHLRVVGRLTPLAIPVSQFLVYPVLGYLDQEQPWQPNPSEVAEVFAVKLSELQRPEIAKKEIWKRPKGPRLIPFFDFQGKQVWGATAMMLAELKALLASC